MPRGSCRGVKINNEAAISPFTQSRSHMHSVGGFPYAAFLVPNGNHCSESASHCFPAPWYKAKQLLLACIPPRMRAYNYGVNHKKNSSTRRFKSHLSTIPVCRLHMRACVHAYNHACGPLCMRSSMHARMLPQYIYQRCLTRSYFLILGAMYSIWITSSMFTCTHAERGACVAACMRPFVHPS